MQIHVLNSLKAIERSNIGNKYVIQQVEDYYYIQYLKELQLTAKEII